jgi:hypothetical protein
MSENKDILRSFADNPALMEEVKRLLLDQFSPNGLKATESDIILGQMVRARLVNIEGVEAVFKKIANCRTINTSVPKDNPAY